MSKQWEDFNKWDPPPTKGQSKPTPRCYESHKGLPIGDYVIYGGSCGYPIVKDADIYVGFDYSIQKSIKSYPWNSGESFLFHIIDQQAPQNIPEFIKLIAWLSEQLKAGKKIHLGCIGGHGRTGTVLAALVAVMLGEKDAIQYVRKHYCHKAVESKAQIDFLVREFGVSLAEPAKGYIYQQPKAQQIKAPNKVTTLPGITPALIWGDMVVFDKS